MTPHWYAVYTRPRCEKKVSQLLTKKRIENYCPLNKVQRQWSDRKKIVEIPLFTSYVFVHISKEQYSMVREVSGIINYVYWLGKPAVIRDEEIEVIKNFLEEYQTVQLEKTEVRVNDHVRILAGPLELLEGNVIEVMPKTVRVILPSLGYTIKASVNRTNIKKIDLLAAAFDA